MVGKTSHIVEDVLSDSQLAEVVKKCVGEARWQLVAAELAPAAEGIAGLFADYFRLALTVKVENRLVKIPLFVKSMPLNNTPKVKFINRLKFFTREKAMYKLMDQMEEGRADPWHTQAYLCSDSVIVMSDLALQGYSTLNQLETFDLPHVRVALASIARFHASTANYETRQQLTLGRPYRVTEAFGGAMHGYPTSPWLLAGAKLVANFIQHFSDKYRNTIPNLESKVTEQFIKACADFSETKYSLNTLKVAVHSDLWGNNILFKHEGGVPTNAIIVDFQCMCYAPPAFDVMEFWHYTTFRSFREENEAEVLRHYFTVFMDSVDENTKLRLKSLGYDYKEFLRWVDKSRRFGLFKALMMYPSVLMDPCTAAEAFGDPSTFEERFNQDRSEPVLAHARRCPGYRRRLLEAVEEFVERYLQAYRTSML